MSLYIFLEYKGYLHNFLSVSYKNKYFQLAEVAQRTKAPVLKTGSAHALREFESPPQRNFKEDHDLPLIFFFVGTLSQFFLLISVFDSIFRVHYSLILRIASTILKIFLLFSMSSNGEDYYKKLYTTSSDLIYFILSKAFADEKTYFPLKRQ